MSFYTRDLYRELLSKNPYYDLNRRLMVKSYVKWLPGVKITRKGRLALFVKHFVILARYRSFMFSRFG